MHFKILTAATALSLSAAALAQQAAEPTFTADAFRAHVAFLADDLLEGRNAGERGYDLAARYVATRFEALGLTPAAEGSWYQQVPFQESRLGEAPATLTIGGKSFANGENVLIGPSAHEPRQELSGEVVFVGFGLDAPESGFDDYAGLDVEGKVVAMLSGFPKGTPSELGAHLASEKARMAQEHGAVGIISIPTRTSLKAVPWERRQKYAGEPSLSWVGTDGTPYDSAPAIRFSASLNMPAAEALFAGAPKPLSAVLDAAEKTGGKPKGFALKPSIEFERSSVKTTLTSPNVVAVLPGSDPALADEYVLLMAHLDHDGVKDEGEDRIMNGAMDNASGIATMLEVARAMATSPKRPKRPILFAAVTAEEDGLLGSQYLAKNPVVDGKVVGVVNLDMPVLLYDFTDVIAFGAEHSTLGPIVERAAGRMNVALAEDPMPEQGLFTRSDHYRFVQEGVPSVFLMTGFSNGGKEKFTHFLSTNYHTVSDEIALPFDWQAGAKFARINYLIAREIADAPEAPRWYANDFFGDTFAPEASKATAP